MKKVVFLTIAALFMFGCTKTSECYVEKAETLTDVKSGCRSLTEISEIAQKAAMNFISDGTKSNIAVKIASIIPYNEALTKSSEEPLCYVVGYENRGSPLLALKRICQKFLSILRMETTMCCHRQVKALRCIWGI